MRKSQNAPFRGLYLGHLIYCQVIKTDPKKIAAMHRLEAMAIFALERCLPLK